jgi:hypothetical protein
MALAKSPPSTKISEIFEMMNVSGQAKAACDSSRDLPDKAPQ